MKSLRAFWHWVDNERPESITLDHASKLSATARLALDTAKDWVSERAYGHARAPLTGMPEHWPAVRDLSILLCTALEVMHEDVPEAAADAWLASQYPPGRVAAFDVQAAMQQAIQRGYVELQPGVSRADTERRFNEQLRANLSVNEPPKRAPETDHERMARYMSWAWQPTEKHIHVYWGVDVTQAERMRGYQAQAITLHGGHSHYDHSALTYLVLDVLAPMLADGAVLYAPHGAMREFVRGLGYIAIEPRVTARLEPPVGAD